MKAPTVLTNEFVKTVPDQLEERTLYVSMDYATVIHKCCCGCGTEVVTPLSPNDWKLTYDGVTISLFPSIGNWSYDCQSHYWIVENTVRWADRWSRKQIAAGRAHDRRARQEYFTADEEAGVENVVRGDWRPSFWYRLWSWLSR